MKKDKFNLGTIELGNEVVVSDPCYSLGTWCQGHLTDVKAGKYNAFMNKASFDDWGRRVTELWVCLEGTSKKFPKKLVGNIDIGVDSGSAGIFDARYYEKHHPIGGEMDKKWYKRQFELCYIYDMDGNKVNPSSDTERRDGVVLDGKGCVSFSGYGDGSYTLFVELDEEKKITSLGIKFI